MLLQVVERDELRTERERNPHSRSASFKQHRSSLSGGSVESRMAELDDIQRSMEEAEEANFEEDRFKSREHYETDSDSVSSVREGSYRVVGCAREPRVPSPVETYINNNTSGIDRIATHEWTFEEQFKQVSADFLGNSLSVFSRRNLWKHLDFRFKDLH